MTGGMLDRGEGREEAEEMMCSRNKKTNKPDVVQSGSAVQEYKNKLG